MDLFILLDTLTLSRRVTRSAISGLMLLGRPAVPVGLWLLLGALAFALAPEASRCLPFDFSLSMSWLVPWTTVAAVGCASSGRCILGDERVGADEMCERRQESQDKWLK
jgi:hypothetical protein